MVIKMENLLDKKSNTLSRLIGVIIILTLCFFLLVKCLGISFFTNDVLLFIDNRSTTTYKREQLAYPSLFKTVIIKNDDNTVGLGYAIDENEYYYCVHGTKQYHGKYYIPDSNGMALYFEEHDISMKAEIVFKEDAIYEGAVLDAYVNIYYDGHIFNTAWIEAKITIEKIYSHRVSYRVDEILFVDGIFQNYAHTSFDSIGKSLIRDCFDAFNDFLIANNFKEFHRK